VLEAVEAVSEIMVTMRKAGKQTGGLEGVPTRKYFRPLDFSVQVGGYVSTCRADKNLTNASDEIPKKQTQTVWEMFIGVNPVEILGQGSVRSHIKLIQESADLESCILTGSTNQIASDKFDDPVFTEQFKLSVRESLNEKLPAMLGEIVHLVLLSALFDVCDKYQIPAGDKRRLKKILAGKRQSIPQLSDEEADSFEHTDAVLKKFQLEDEERSRSLIDRLFKTPPGLKKGAIKTPKAFMEKLGQPPTFTGRDDFFQKLNKRIYEADDTKRKSIARYFGISADALDDLRKKTYGDRRSWPTVVSEAKKMRRL